jgi:Cytochrome P460
MDPMFSPAESITLLAVAILGGSLQEPPNPPASAGPEYTVDGQLNLPEHYREWIYLSSDFYVNTDPAKMQMGRQKGFINVFVNPEAYRVFLQTGTWADKTMFVAELRGAEDMGSTNQNRKGSDQSSVIGLDVHEKDATRLPGQWAFFDFKGDKTARMMPVTAACYSCHGAHAAVDTTFVQFYPTLLPTAKSKNTLSVAYRQEVESAVPIAK